MSQFVEQGHLGGYVAGGDEATYYPDLWTWLVDDFGVRSVLDVGAGDGVAVDFFYDQISDFPCPWPPQVFGLEGVPQNNPRIIEIDFTKEKYEEKNDPTSDNFYWGDIPYGYYDLCWCCEFVEHVEEQFIPNFMSAFKMCATVLMTHAEPGQAGYHHVNCQPANYWVAKMREIGYYLDTDLTFTTRLLARKNENPWNHYARSGLAFRRVS